MILGINAGAAVAPISYYWVRYDATGSEQSEVVGSYTQCDVFIIGAAGGGGRYNAGAGGSGAGGYSVGGFTVTPGETLKVHVGSGGGGGTKGVSNSGGDGGWPGGGNGSWGDTWCGGGGGYSGVFRSDNTPLVIAGAGGGGSGFSSAAGAGGGTNGQSSSGAGGGTQSAGGSGAFPGSSLQGGNANAGDRFTSTAQDDGGGGGGFFGGGAHNGDGRGGAGGSGHIGSGATGTTYAGSGLDRPAEIPPTINGESTSGFGVGVAGSASTDGTAPSGGNGVIWLRFSS